jgi:GH35 family endo-1,4-beta-xylanase
MHTFLWWSPDPIVQRDVRLVAEAGFGWIKQNVGWRDVEKFEGLPPEDWDWALADRVVAYAEQYHLDVLLRLDHQPLWTGGWNNGPPRNLDDFGRFCGVLADRYRGRVRAYQVWNEPNLAREWADRRPAPAEYVELLRVCYVAIKAADPEAIVVSAGLAPTGTDDEQAMPDDKFLRGMYEADALPYFDMLGLHAPGYKAPPELSPDEAATNPDYGGQRAFAFRHVEDMRAIMEEYGDGDKQIAIVEFGWTTDPREASDYHWHAVTEEQKADYLVRAFRYAREHWSPWVGLMVVVYLADPAWSDDHEQYWWAITEPHDWELRLRPAYEALRDMEK